jgi:hypothetical protein
MIETLPACVGHMAVGFPTNGENEGCRFYGCCVGVGVKEIIVGVLKKDGGSESGAVGVGVGCTAVTRLNHIQTQNATTAMTVSVPLMMRLMMRLFMQPVY